MKKAVKHNPRRPPISLCVPTPDGEMWITLRDNPSKEALEFARELTHAKPTPSRSSKKNSSKAKVSRKKDKKK